MAPALKGSNGKHFGAGHNALPSTAVDAYLKHLCTFRLPGISLLDRVKCNPRLWNVLLWKNEFLI